METQKGKSKSGSQSSSSGKASTLLSSIQNEGFSLANIEKYADELKGSVIEVVETSVEFIKTHPVYTILGAATLGFAAASLIKKGAPVAKNLQ